MYVNTSKITVKSKQQVDVYLSQRELSQLMSQQILYKDINQKMIFSVFSEAEKTLKHLVIMSHGFRGSSLGPARQFVDFQKMLDAEGISTLRFDQPNSGNSQGDFFDSSYNEWVQTIVSLAKEYIDLGYKVSLLGQSMGASASVIAANDQVLKNKISNLLLWVPDPKENIDLNPDETFEEGGQKYKGKFWLEASKANFFECLQDFNGGIHLVYGENDKYVSKELREKTIKIITSKEQRVMILPNQDHSPWEFDHAQEVYKEELDLLKDS